MKFPKLQQRIQILSNIVPLEDGPLDDELWHCIDVCHSAAKRPFGSSMLQVYIDGAKRMECILKYPITEPISYCTVS